MRKPHPSAIQTDVAVPRKHHPSSERAVWECEVARRYFGARRRYRPGECQATDLADDVRGPLARAATRSEAPSAQPARFGAGPRGVEATGGD